MMGSWGAMRQLANCGVQHGRMVGDCAPRQASFAAQFWRKSTVDRTHRERRFHMVDLFGAGVD